MPEYNGSIPGIFKTFIDSCNIDTCFRGKKAALVGIAAGRAGNLRGLDHLTDILHHSGCEVLSYKLPISSIRQLFDENNEFKTTETKSAIEKQVEMFLRF